MCELNLAGFIYILKYQKMGNKVNNKYFLSAFMCLLSATAVKAEQNSHQSGIVKSEVDVLKASSTLQEYVRIDRYDKSLFNSGNRKLSISQLQPFNSAIAQRLASFKTSARNNNVGAISLPNVSSPAPANHVGE